MQFAQICASRNHDQPRPAAIVAQEHAAKREIGNGFAACGQARVKNEAH
jgi:hypothetical protein